MKQTSTPIEFYKQRDLGEKINATFDFLKNNFKEIFMLLLKTVLPISAVIVIIPIFFPDFFISNYRKLDYFNASAPFVMMIYYIGYVIATLYTTSTVLTLLYRKSVGAQNDMGNTLDIQKEIRSNMSSIFVSGLLVGLIVFGCLLLLIIPGIIVSVMLSFVSTVVVFEKLSPSKAVSRCWKLGTTEWWPTLGLMIVVSLISGIVNLILSVPNLVVTFVIMFSQTSPEELGIIMKLVYYLTTLIATFGGFLISTVLVVAISFQWANIREIKEGYSLQNKISHFEENQ